MRTTVWTEDLERRLIFLYPNITNAEIAKILNLRETQISAKAFKLGLKKTREFKFKHALKTMFKKGNVPANKGKKQTEFMTPAAIERTKNTRFKKGQLPHNSIGVKDGDIRIRHDHKNRGGKAYKYIRLELGKWYPLHQYLWQQANGSLPKGYCLWFRDGNTMNCELTNLELITRAENMRRNSCSRNLTDKYVANTLARAKGMSGGIDRQSRDSYLQDKELINTARQTIILKHIIKKKAYGTK